MLQKTLFSNYLLKFQSMEKITMDSPKGPRLHLPSNIHLYVNCVDIISIYKTVSWRPEQWLNLHHKLFGFSCSKQPVIYGGDTTSQTPTCQRSWFTCFCGCCSIIQWNPSAVVAIGMGSITGTSNCFPLHSKAKPLVLSVHRCSGASLRLAIIADHKSRLWTNCCWTSTSQMFICGNELEGSAAFLQWASYICIMNLNK